MGCQTDELEPNSRQKRRGVVSQHTRPEDATLSVNLPSGRPLRFVVLSHDWPEPHWDLLVEPQPGAERVATWALNALPGATRLEGLAERLPDHRRHYLDYEGPVEGDRGTVSRVIAGSLTVVLNDVELHFDMNGVDRHGVAILGRLRFWRDERLDQRSSFKHRIQAKAGWRFDWITGI